MMSRKGKNTSSEVRQLVIFNYAKGKSGNAISRLLNLPRSTICDILKRFKEDRIESHQQEGRPEKLTEVEKRFIGREIEKNPKFSAPKLAAESLLERTGMEVTAQTIRNVIRSMG